MKQILVASLTVLLMAACGGGGGGGGNPNPPPVVPPPVVVPPTPQLPSPTTAPAMKTVLAANFEVGAAIEPASTTGATDRALLIRHFGSITAENAMKPATIQPSAAGNPDVPAALNFGPADTLVTFALANNIKVRGHTLLWHQTAPSWFFAGCTADPAGCLPFVRARLCNYIDEVIGHFGANIYAWDVVNEVASDTPNLANPYRTTSAWYQAYLNAQTAGASVQPYDYIEDAFRCAAQARTNAGLNSGNLKLMINDYNTELPGKRANLMAIVHDLRLKGVPIDGVGHQFHLQLNASVAEVTAALVAVEQEEPTLVNHVTELDVSIYTDPGSCFASGTACQADYGASVPQSALSAQATLYRALFNAFKRPSVTSVTTWGIADNHTWLNSFPVNRTNRPLLFDTAGNPKWAFWTVVDSTIVFP